MLPKDLMFEEGGGVVSGDGAVGRVPRKMQEGFCSGSSSRDGVVRMAPFQRRGVLCSRAGSGDIFGLR